MAELAQRVESLEAAQNVMQAAQTQLANGHNTLLTAINTLTTQLTANTTELTENTKLTKETAADAKGVVTAFKNLQGGLKVMGALGKFAAVCSAIGSAVLTAYLTFKAFIRP